MLYSKSAAAVKCLGFVFTRHFDAESYAVPGGRVDTRCRQGGKYPDLLIIHEQVRVRTPVPVAAVVLFQVKDMLFAKPLGALSKAGHAGVM